MKKLTFLLLLISFQSFSQEWGLVWQEEFNYAGAPDNNKWGFDTGGHGFGNQELQYYTDREENARVENGNLAIVARKEAYEGNDYTSAKLITKNKADWKYGRLEVRAKLPSGTGVWPAIWLLPTEERFSYWPSSGEIDVMEYVGFDPETVHFNIHTEAYNHRDGTGRGQSTTLNSPESQFYTYILEWYPEKLVFKVDDQTTFTYEKESDDYRVWPFDEHFYLILNIAVGGAWGGLEGVDDEIFPQEFLIDYVRFYKLQETAGPYTVSSEITGGSGYVSASPNQDEFADSTMVTLTAIPDEGNRFVRWTGDFIGTSNEIIFPIRSDVTVFAEFIDENELVENGDFSNGSHGWTINPGADSNSGDAETGEVCMTINDPMENPWDIAIAQGGLVLEQGKEYKLRFSAYSTQSRTIKVGVGMDRSPYSTYYYPTEDITTQKQEFEHTYTMTSATDEGARVMFDIGGSTGNVCLDNISIQDASVTGTTKENGPCSVSLSDNSLNCQNKAIKELRVIGLDGKVLKTLKGRKAEGVKLDQLKSQGASLVVIVFENGESQVVKNF